MSRIEEFEESRPLLYSIAYRILGGERDAEDAVHETRSRYLAAPTVPTPAGAYLAQMVTRISADVLRSAGARRERHPGPAHPEPLPEDPFPDLERPAGLAASLSTAVVLLLERLSPRERAFFALREMFGCDMGQIAGAVGCSEGACQQLAAAVTRASDGEGAGPPWPGFVIGCEQVARVLAAVVPALIAVGVTMEPHEVRSRPGAVFRDRAGTVLSALSIDFLDGRIHTIRWAVPDRA